MNHILLLSTCFVLLAFATLSQAQDDTVPDIPVAEVVVDDKGNLVPKSTSEISTGSKVCNIKGWLPSLQPHRSFNFVIVENCWAGATPSLAI